MQVSVSGKQVDVGEALRSRIVDELSLGIGKYFERGGKAEVVVSKENHAFRVDCTVTLASGQYLVSHALGGDAHGAFDGALSKIETRIRRYKRRLRNHHAPGGRSPEIMPLTVLRPIDESEADEADGYATEDAGTPRGMVIAETETPIRTLTVSMAVLELDLSSFPLLLFRNAAHGGLSLVYRRQDGNIGWIDPERTRAASAA